MSTTLPVIPEQLEAEGVGLLARVNALVVQNHDTYVTMTEYAKLGRAGLKAGHEAMDETVEATNHAHKVALASRARVLAPWQALIVTADAKCIAWDTEQKERHRIEAERVESERRRLQAEADAAAAQENARLAKIEEDRRLEAAIEAEATGDHDTAARLLEAPIITATVIAAPVFVAPVTPSETAIKGVSYRTDYSARVTDLRLLIEAVATGTVPMTVLQENQTALNGLARSLKEGFSIPGVELVAKRTMIGKIP